MTRPMGVFKSTNEYMKQIDPALYETMPKAVFAAIAVSHFVNTGDSSEEITQALLDEWQVLYLNGIVPQKPPKVQS